MIGQTISHYKILEKLRQEEGGQVGEVRLSGMAGERAVPLAYSYLDEPRPLWGRNLVPTHFYRRNGIR